MIWLIMQIKEGVIRQSRKLEEARSLLKTEKQRKIPFKTEIWDKSHHWQSFGRLQNLSFCYLIWYVSQQVAVLRRMKKMLPFETRMKLYQSFIVPHFNYCAETWNFCSKGVTTKLEKLNERALRFVYRDYSSSYETLLKQSG